MLGSVSHLAPEQDELTNTSLDSSIVTPHASVMGGTGAYGESSPPRPTSSCSSQPAAAAVNLAGSIDDEAAAFEAAVAAIERENALLEQQLHEKDARVRQLRQRARDGQLAVEREEERQSHIIMRQEDAAKRSIGDLSQRIRQTERQNQDCLRRIESLKLERVRIENSIETEQECLVHSLHRQILQGLQEKSSLNSRLQDDRSHYLTMIREQMAKLQASLSNPHRAATPNLSGPPRSSSGTLATGTPPLNHTATAAEPTATTPPVGADANTASAQRIANRVTSSSDSPTTPASSTATAIAAYEREIATIVSEMLSSENERAAVESQISAQAESLRKIETTEFLEKVKQQRLREDLSRARALLEAETALDETTLRSITAPTDTVALEQHATNRGTPDRPMSVPSQPILASPQPMQPISVASRGSLGATWTGGLHHFATSAAGGSAGGGVSGGGGHQRTASTSSIESFSSVGGRSTPASSSCRSSSQVNTALLTAKDPKAGLKEHTARILSTPMSHASVALTASSSDFVGPNSARRLREEGDDSGRPAASVPFSL